MDYLQFIVLNQKEESRSMQRVHLCVLATTESWSHTLLINALKWWRRIYIKWHLSFCFLIYQQIRIYRLLQVWVSFIPLFHTGDESPESPRIIFLFGGIREVSLNFFLQSWCYTSQSRFRYDVVTNIWGNHSIRLESRKNSLRLAK